MKTYLHASLPSIKKKGVWNKSISKKDKCRSHLAKSMISKSIMGSQNCNDKIPTFDQKNSKHPTSWDLACPLPICKRGKWNKFTMSEEYCCIISMSIRCTKQVRQMMHVTGCIRMNKEWKPNTEETIPSHSNHLDDLYNVP